MSSGGMQPKRIVYLWGAGATHAEMQRLGGSTSLLMANTDAFGPGLTTRILERTGKQTVASYGVDQGVDIEKLISLLSASGTVEHSELAEKLRSNYFKELKVSLSNVGILKQPTLANKLLEMHADPHFSSQVESLSGIITTNHDGLLQVASQTVHQGINIGLSFVSTTYVDRRDIPPIIQIHGSFTWKFGLPIVVRALSLQSEYTKTVWIPPTITKESKSYPFNKLNGRAYELLARKCDVLRVVGTSLTQNDWNVLSLIFNAQRHRELTEGEAFQVELIMPLAYGEHIVRDCGYLKNLRAIGFLSEGNFAAYKDGEPPADSDLANPLLYWLTEKVDFHQKKGHFSRHQPLEGQAA